ncbi:Eco29kI family restriction endonuclease [Lentzea sp. NPDC051208]|uniref:Eco29kI family restriction endonuclease n=1 Tax=Lentzea sp. NPDC051208 TaxID=3154642 RepID=UPI0034271664
MTSPPEFDKPVKPKRPRKPQWKTWAKDAVRPAPYNPLDLEQLGESVERRLLLETSVPLTAVPKTIGPGVYAIYYQGDHDLYQPIKGVVSPIYVGKAVPQGGRKGIVDPSKETSALWDRLQEHKHSIEEAGDLDPDDFSVRFLVAVEVFVPLAERVMIQQLRPVWNLVVDGFGNHDPGAGRRNQARPPWDELHPGRWWSHPYYMNTPSKYSQEQSVRRVTAFFEGADVEYDVNLDGEGPDEANAEHLMLEL